jgi:REP element-mobilizing transposase RayT
MSQTLTQIYLHIVFSTKNRMRAFQEKGLRAKTHAHLAGTCKNLHSPALVVGGVEDHVHALSRLSRHVTVADFVRELKRESSKWIKTECPHLGNFHWQAGYGAFSISPSHVEMLRQYIENQEAHHATETFQDEFRRLCQKYEVPIDERYAWD